jgi:hypothetical protein
MRRPAFVDQHIEAAELLHAKVDQLPRGSLLAQVPRKDLAATACRTDLVSHVVRVLVPDLGDHDLGASARKAQSHGTTKPAAGAGDDCRLSVDLHRALSRFFGAFGNRTPALS